MPDSRTYADTVPGRASDASGLPPPAPDAATPAPEPAGVWAQLAERLNPIYERPVLRHDVVCRRFVTARGDSYAICKSPSTGTYLRLGPEEHDLLDLMDGEHQVKDLAIAYFLRHKAFATRRIAALVARLRCERFLTEEPRDAWDGLRQQVARRTWAARVERLAGAFVSREFPVTGIDGALTFAYRWGGWLAFTRPFLVLWLVVSVIGVALFAHELLVIGRDPFRLNGSSALGALVLGLLALVSISTHELGHALAAKRYGREVHRGGFMIYYGAPTFFVDVTDIWMEPRRARIVVSLAGMAAVWGLGGLAMLYALTDRTSVLGALAFQFAFASFVDNSVNLLPLLELDGYYVLMDWLEIPLLRARAFAFVRRDLWRALRGRRPLNREERILAVFGALALVGSALALAAAVYFWLAYLRDIVVEAWSGDSPLLRLLVVLGLVAIGLPLLTGLAIEAQRMTDVGRAALARRHHRGVEAEARARLDARALVGRLRFLHALDFAQREAIVHRLRLVRFRRGASVVREGDAGDCFYLIRSGEAEVLQVDATGWPRRLVVLRPGDYFGELALLHAQPRLASVRALTTLEVFVLDREAFGELVAPRLREYGLTLERIRERTELAGMALFGRTPPTELDALLERLETSEVPPGAILVRQGEPGDRFYLVRQGEVEVRVRDATGPERVVGQLGPGEYFGELALLTDAPRTATVVAREPTTLWSLDADGFRELLLAQLRLAEPLRTEGERRTTHNRLAGEVAS